MNRTRSVAARPMGEEKRTSARIVTDFAVVLLDHTGVVIDDHAVAHDVSVKGFRAELHGSIEDQQIVRFRMTMGGGREIAGRARVVYIQRTDFGIWVGAEFRGLSWADKRLLSKSTATPTGNRALFTQKAVLDLVWIGGALTLLLGLLSHFWRPQIFGLLPEVIAAAAFGWALLEILAPRR